jgi:phage gpG-like protein
MAIKFNRSETFATNGTVTAAGLHNLIDGTDIYQALITDQTNLTSVGSGDELLIADADLTANDAPRAVTVNELFEDALTISTYTNANINNISYGTSTGTRLVSTNASITTGTIPSLTAGTTTSTVATIPTLTAGTTTSTAANITNGTVQTLTASTANISSGSAIFSQGTVTTFNSTTGTISNLSTTLTGDLTISTGSATVGTRVAVVNTAQEYTATHNFNATSLTITSGTIPWDLSANQVAKLEVTTNSTLNTPTNPVDGATYMLVVTQGTGGSNTLSFSTAYKFPGGSAPVLSTGSSDVDVLAFISNGTVLYGVTSQDFS